MSGCREWGSATSSPSVASIPWPCTARRSREPRLPPWRAPGGRARRPPRRCAGDGLRRHAGARHQDRRELAPQPGCVYRPCSGWRTPVSSSAATSPAPRVRALRRRRRTASTNGGCSTMVATRAGRARGTETEQITLGELVDRFRRRPPTRSRTLATRRSSCSMPDWPSSSRPRLLLESGAHPVDISRWRLSGTGGQRDPSTSTFHVHLAIWAAVNVFLVMVCSSRCRLPVVPVPDARLGIGVVAHGAAAYLIVPPGTSC